MALKTPDLRSAPPEPVTRLDEAEYRHGHRSLREESVFASLTGSVRDLLFPVKLPPLVLESTPIEVPDRMSVKRDPKSTVAAVLVNGSLLLLALWWGARKIQSIDQPLRRTAFLSTDDLPKAPPRLSGIDGGGGQTGLTPVSRGNPPKFSPDQILPPKIPPLEQPPLAVDPTVDVQKDLKMARVDVPNLGMPNAPLVGTSMGNSKNGGSGIGPGDGPGMGPGKDGNTGGGSRHLGGGVLAPEVLFKPEPEFSEAARRAKVTGTVTLSIVVDANGTAQNVKVVKALGMGLDEKAVEAVKQYRFKPAMQDRKPVPFAMYVEVDFQIF